MSFWSDFKAKRALKKAHQQFADDYADWHRDVEIFKKIETAFVLAVKGEDEPKAPTPASIESARVAKLEIEAPKN